MCKVIRFQFACGHHLRLRRSRCRGTKHKVTRYSVKAACTADSYIGIKVPYDCGACQHTEWEGSWRLKLARAKLFLEELPQRGLPGAREIERLVHALEEEYTVASWDARNKFGHADRRHIKRVDANDFREVASPLLKEVRPEDVDVARIRGWVVSGDEEEDDGDEYILNSDSFHAVSTNYAHPLDGIDDSWIENCFSPEELETETSDHFFDVNESGWSWDDGVCDDYGEEVEPEPGEDRVDVNTEKWSDTEPTPWDTDEVKAFSVPEIIVHEVDSPRKKKEKEGVGEVIKAFWGTVTIKETSSEDEDDDIDNDTDYVSTDPKLLREEEKEEDEEDSLSLALTNPESVFPLPPSTSLATWPSPVTSPASAPTPALTSTPKPSQTSRPTLDSPTTQTPTTTPTSPPPTQPITTIPTSTSTPAPTTLSPLRPALRPRRSSASLVEAKNQRMRREAEMHKNTDLRRYYEIWLRVSRLELKQQCSGLGLAGKCIPDPVPYHGRVGGGKRATAPPVAKNGVA